jgi:hypothetical protein
MIKSIGYAYATSTIATQLGARASGCYYVATQADETDADAKVVGGPYASLEEGEARCARPDLRHVRWSRYTKRAAVANA